MCSFCGCLPCPSLPSLKKDLHYMYHLILLYVLFGGGVEGGLAFHFAALTCKYYYIVCICDYLCVNYGIGCWMLCIDTSFVIKQCGPVSCELLYFNVFIKYSYGKTPKMTKYMRNMLQDVNLLVERCESRKWYFQNILAISTRRKLACQTPQTMITFDCITERVGVNRSM